MYLNHNLSVCTGTAHRAKGSAVAVILPDGAGGPGVSSLEGGPGVSSLELWQLVRAFAEFLGVSSLDELWRAFAEFLDERVNVYVTLGRSVLTWGSSEHGGDSSAVQEDLVDVVDISATNAAFAAIRSDGRVVTWGSSKHGGDSSAVQEDLVGVRSISATQASFAAIRSDGKVVTWGSSKNGGDSSAVQGDLVGVQSISAGGAAFAAIRSDGRVVTWGPSKHLRGDPRD